MYKTDGFVYLIGEENCKYVKIGMTTQTVQERLNGLKTGMPYKLFILNSFPSDNPRKEEADLHRKFKQFHHEREWFRFDISIYEEFEDIVSKRFITPIIDEPSYVEDFFNACKTYARYCNDPELTYEYHIKELFRDNKYSDNTVHIDDNFKFKFGKYKGYKAIDVPKSYLLWCQENIDHDKLGII